MSDVQRELKELNFKEEVLKKEKQLLVQFANIVSKIHSVKVQPVCYSVCVCVCVCVCVRLSHSRGRLVGEGGELGLWGPWTSSPYKLQGNSVDTWAGLLICHTFNLKPRNLNLQNVSNKVVLQLSITVYRNDDFAGMHGIVLGGMTKRCDMYLCRSLYLYMCRWNSTPSLSL